MLACLPEVDTGPETEHNLKLFPTPETARRAHVSDFLLGAILQLSSAYRGSGSDCSKPVQTSCSDRQGRARKGAVEQNALCLCTGSQTQGNKSMWFIIGKCTEETELSSLHATDQSILQREDRQRWRAASGKGQTSCLCDGITAVTWSQLALVQQTLTSRSITSEGSAKMLMKRGRRGRFTVSLLSQIKHIQQCSALSKETSACQYKGSVPNQLTDRNHTLLCSCLFPDLKMANWPLLEQHTALH